MATIYYTACSLDGFIAGPGHNLDWLLSRDNDLDGPDSYAEFINGVGAVVMGANTYQWVLEHLDGPWPYHVPTWVMTHRTFPQPPGDVRFTRAPVAEVHQLAVGVAAGRDVWLVEAANWSGSSTTKGCSKSCASSTPRRPSAPGCLCCHAASTWTWSRWPATATSAALGTRCGADLGRPGGAGLRADRRGARCLGGSASRRRGRSQLRRMYRGFGRSGAEDAGEESPVGRCLLGRRAGAALVLGHAAHDLLLVLTAAGPGALLAGPAGRLMAHCHHSNRFRCLAGRPDYTPRGMATPRQPLREQVDMRHQGECVQGTSQTGAADATRRASRRRSASRSRACLGVEGLADRQDRHGEYQDGEAEPE